MAQTATHGDFVWYDLMTTDQKAAIDFYSRLVGWTTQTFGEATADKPAYMMWVGSQGPLGGVMVSREEERKKGVPAQWMAHVMVSDIDASVAKARKLGANIHVEPTGIPTVGRFAVLQDPQGAHLAVFTPNEAMTLHDNMKDGEFSWNELLTTDHGAAFRFYSDLFGWEKLQSLDMGPAGEYLIYGAHGRTLGGMFTRGKDMPMPPTWFYYIHVSDLDGAVATLKANGGKVMNGPMEVPGGDRIVQGTDPQGAYLALHESKRT